MDLGEVSRAELARVWLTEPEPKQNSFLLCPGEDSTDLIRHFLVESSAKGVHLKGADEEPYFGKPPQPPQAPAASAASTASTSLPSLHASGLGLLHCESVWESPTHSELPAPLQGASLPSCTSTASWPWPCPANSPSHRKVGQTHCST